MYLTCTIPKLNAIPDKYICQFCNTEHDTKLSGCVKIFVLLCSFHITNVKYHYVVFMLQKIKNPYLNILLHYLLFLLSNFTTAPLTPPDIAVIATSS